MWLDILIAAVFALSTAQGLRKGFAFSLFHSIGLVASVILGYFLYPSFGNLLRRFTGLYDNIHRWLVIKIGGNNPGRIASFLKDLPKPLQEAAENAERTITASISSGLTDFMFNIFSFLLVVVLIRLLLILLPALFSKKHHHGLIGFIDGFFGLLFGAGRGILIIFLLLALLVPLISIIKSDIITNALEASILAQPMYDSNPIFLWLKGFL
ncbi:MAG TPA: CvpA family protein [Clostridiales bacterium]|jgi:uncharacterized membrane protein required for colicin V production|nr:CvpA family protein [Clostridiales bacterium]